MKFCKKVLLALFSLCLISCCIATRTKGIKRVKLDHDCSNATTDENIFIWLSDNFKHRQLPNELIDKIFSCLAGQGYLEKLMHLGNMTAGWNAVGDIIMQSWITIMSDFNEKLDKKFEYFDEETKDHEFRIHVGSFVAFKKLFDDKCLNRYIRKIDVRFAERIQSNVGCPNFMMFQRMHPERYNEIKDYINELKNQLTSLAIKTDFKESEYVKNLPTFSKVTEARFGGVLHINGKFNFNVKFPKATTIKIEGNIMIDKESLSGYVKINELAVPVRVVEQFHYPESEIRNVIANNSNLNVLSLTTTRQFETIKLLESTRNLTELQLGDVDLSLLNYSSKPIKIPSVKTLGIGIMEVNEAAPYNPAYDCEKVENLQVQSRKWTPNILTNVIGHYAKGKYGEHNIERIKFIEIKDAQYLVTIIQSITNVKIIELDQVGPFCIEIEYELVNMFKSCPKKTELDKVIVHNIAEYNCIKLLGMENEFLKIGWNFSVGHADFITARADVTFTR